MTSYTLPTNAIRKQRPLAHWAFLLGIFTAAAFFIPYIAIGKGYFLFYGDFNVQQVPFYQLCHKAVRAGDIGWSFGTDLGANFVGSYTFYLLGSPFFWLTLPFPNAVVPYLMGPLLILKFGCASLTAYLYIRRFVRHSESALLGGLLYAFSGFSVYNIFFNHFHEAIIVFPLLLLSIEMHITEKRRGVFAGMVCVAALTNYFFFYGMVVFSVLYWFIRTVSGNWKQTFKGFLSLAFEAVLGLLMSLVLLLPTVLCVLQNNRLSSVNLGYDSWLYGRVQIYANILEIFFFPPDIPARPVFFPDADIKWSSMGAWLPLVSMVGVFAFWRSNKGHWIRRLLGVCFFMAMVPILNSAFYMFNSSYYARWYFMPILMMCLASVMAIEDDAVDWKPAFRTVFIITAVVSLIVGLWPAGQNDDGSITHFGIYTYEENSFTYIGRYWATCAIALISLAALYALLKLYRKYHLFFIRNAVAAVCVLSVIYAAVFIGCGKSHSYDITGEVIPNLIEGELKLDGNPDTFRIDCYECMDNTAMFLGYSGINAFHSIVPGSVVDFYEYIGEERSVASRPTTESYAIRPLLSVKYLLSREGGDSFTDDDGTTKMPGYTFLKQEDGFNVYENNNYIPYGFTYDYYISQKDCDEIDGSQRANMMVKALLLDDSQVKKYGHLLKNVADTDYYLDEETLASDAADRKKSAAYEFKTGKSSFEANIKMSRENLVFFSIPYEEGWSATVNGSPVTIEKVNKGFMAVLCPEGDCEIKFYYTTPGLYAGVMISFVSVLIFAGYLFLTRSVRKTQPVHYNGEWPEGKLLADYWQEHPELEPPKPQNDERDDEESTPSAEEQTTDEEPSDGDTRIDLEALHKFTKEDGQQHDL